MKIKRFQFLPLPVLCCLFLLTGCSSGNVQVKGKVTLTDGTPVACGEVVFEQKTFAANGHIQPDGSYELGSLKANDGLPKGEYVVYIRRATRGSDPVGQGNMVPMSAFTPVIAKAYTSVSDSPLRCNVQKSMTFDIEVPPSGL
jgi:hypothetical protein